MKKQLIRLTESELNQIIEESVRSIINENMEDEGLWDTMKSFGGQYFNRGKKQAQQMGQAAGEKMKQGYNAAAEMGRNAWQGAKQMGQSAGEKMKQGYNAVANDVKNTYKNAQQDGQMKSMMKAFNDFKVAVEKYKAAGGQVNNQLASRIKGIENMMGAYQAHF